MLSLYGLRFQLTSTKKALSGKMQMPFCSYDSKVYQEL